MEKKIQLFNLKILTVVPHMPSTELPKTSDIFKLLYFTSNGGDFRDIELKQSFLGEGWDMLWLTANSTVGGWWFVWAGHV